MNKKQNQKAKLEMMETVALPGQVDLFDGSVTPEATETATTATAGEQEQEQEQERLKDVEKTISAYITEEKLRWTGLYLELKKVQTGALYEQARPPFASFSAWAGDFCTRKGYHVSQLWQTMKAGKVYEEYAEREREIGHVPTPIKEIRIAPENLCNVSRVSNSNDTTAKLIDGLKDGSVTRSDLFRMKVANRAYNNNDSNARTCASARASEGESEATTDGATADAESDANEKEILITAGEVIKAVSSFSWLYPLTAPDADRKNGVFEKMKKAVLFPEFPVRTGTTRQARRIDAMVVENHSIDPHDRGYKFNLHAIEIKVSEYDLITDHKMGEYADFANFAWLAVPASLEKVAREYKIPHWGLLLIDPNKLTVTVGEVARKAEKPPLREALETAIYKATTLTR